MPVCLHNIPEATICESIKKYFLEEDFMSRSEKQISNEIWNSLGLITKFQKLGWSRKDSIDLVTQDYVPEETDLCEWQMIFES